MKNLNEINIICGTGPLGLAVMNELLSQNRKVTMINRSGVAQVPKGVSVIKADIHNFTSILSACKGATRIYNCAKPDYTKWDTDFIPIIKNLIKVAEQLDAIIVHGDNMYMYGEVDGSISERLPYGATSKKGIVRGNIAEMLITAHKEGAVKATIGRGSCFYGPHVDESLVGKNVFMAALEGKAAPVLGDIDMAHTFTYVKDFAKALVILGDSEKALGSEWHIPNAPTITTREFINMIYQEEGNLPKFKIATRKMVSVFGLFNKIMREFKEIMYIYDKPFVVDSEKFIKEFGNFATSHSEGIKDTLEWYKANFSKEGSNL